MNMKVIEELYEQMTNFNIRLNEKYSFIYKVVRKIYFKSL